jgi:hypothetical protein
VYQLQEQLLLLGRLLEGEPAAAAVVAASGGKQVSTTAGTCRMPDAAKLLRSS